MGEREIWTTYCFVAHLEHGALMPFAILIRGENWRVLLVQAFGSFAWSQLL